MTDQRHALAFNAVGPVLFEHDAWLPLSIRKALAEAVLAAIDEPAADPTTADNPVPLRWGLGDVLHGDDDTTIICLSGPNREPYWLELDHERAAALRGDLAGPDRTEAQDHPAAELYVLLRKAGEDRDTAQQLIYAHATMAVRQHQALNGDDQAGT